MGRHVWRTICAALPPALVVAATLLLGASGARAALGDISTVAGGYPAGPVAATAVGQHPLRTAAAVLGGHPYTFVVDGTESVVTRIDDASGQQQVIAGTGVTGSSGDGGVATSSVLDRPSGVAVDAAGDVFIADGGARIRLVPAVSGTFFGQSMTADHIYTIAGNGTAGFSGDGGPATSAEISDGPQFFLSGAAIAVDSAGDLAIADSLNNRVRFVPAASGTFFGQSMTASYIYTIAGDGTGNFGGDSGPATSAHLNLPLGVAFDSAGDLAIADTQNERIRFVPRTSGSFYGNPVMTANDIYTIAGTGVAGGGCAGTGVAATSIKLALPTDVFIDGSGNLAIADTNDHCIRFVPTLPGSFYGQLMSANDMYNIAGNGTGGFSGDGGSSSSAELSSPTGVSLDGSDNLTIADFNNVRVRFVLAAASTTKFGQAMTTDDIYTIAGNGSQGFSGDGVPATTSELFVPTGVAVAPAGGFAIADFGNSRIRFVATASGTVLGQAMTGGNMYTVAGDGTESFGGDGGPATGAQLTEPEGMRFDAQGDMVIADRFNHRVRFVPATSGTYFGQAMTANDIYTIAGNGSSGFGGDGGPATAAQLQEPSGVAMDASGDLVIADTQNQRVRFVPATSGTFFGQAMTANDIYTIAGTGTAGFNADSVPGTSSELNFPEDVTVDQSGNVLIADGSNNRVRALAATSGTFFGQAMTANDIYTIAGIGTHGSTGDGGSPTAAQLNFPEGIALDSIGDLAIADSSNNRVRFIPTRSGSYFGPTMTAGDIYTIAGDGTAGSGGDGGPATSAQLKFPAGVAFDATGDVLVADSSNNRVRMIAGTVPALGGGGGGGGSGGGGGGSGGGGGGTTGTTGKAHVVRVRVHADKVLVTISCAGTAKQRCSTALKLSVTETVRGGRVIALSAATRKPTRKKVVVVGSGTLTLAGGQRRTITISLNRAGRTLLSHRRSLKVTLTVTQGRTRIYRHAETLHRPKPKKHRHR